MSPHLRKKCAVDFDVATTFKTFSILVVTTNCKIAAARQVMFSQFWCGGKNLYRFGLRIILDSNLLNFQSFVNGEKKL